MEEFHANILESIAKEMKPQVYVELGIYCGDTFKRIMNYASRGYACDINNEVYSVASAKSFAYCMRTDEFYDVWNNEIKFPIDLIFIDADHSANSVIKDVNNFYPWLKTDKGIMALHDTWPPSERYVDPGYCGDSYKVKKILKDKYEDMEIFTLPLQYGVSLIRKVGHDWRN